MADILNFALVCAVPAKALSAQLPAQFQHAIDRHQNNLIALSAALKAAGLPPAAAAGYVDGALAIFQNGLSAAEAGQEETYRG